MAERKSTNKYYPPDWDPSKGSINQYVGQHPLRDRAKKLSQGILVIRFEMPYNIWCGGCNSHIGMGVRYNAEKTKTGMYYTTPIYKFRMKCHLCDNYFEIQTDPKNHDYVILEGARRKEQRWDPKENGQIETEDKAVQKKMVTDAMFKLEHGSDDVQKGKKAIQNITSLETRRDEWKDDYILNKIARQKFRDEKKAIKVETDRDAALLGKSSLDIPLLKESGDDIKLAGLIKYRAVESYDEKQAQKRKEIEAQPFFQSSNKIAKREGGSKLDIIKKHIRNSKIEKRTNAFDRMKVNTLISGPAISLQTLGIKKKPSLKDTSSDMNSTKSRIQLETTDTDSADCGQSSNVDNTLVTDRLNESMLDSSIESETVTDVSIRSDCDKDSDKLDSTSNKNVPMTNASKGGIISGSELLRNKTEKSYQSSSLGLVCSYSDTDSDT